MIIQLLIDNTEKANSLIKEAQAIVLLQNGVYCAQELVKNNHVNIYGLRDDFEAAGVNAPPHITLISCEEWVELCASHYPIVTIQ